MVNVADKASVTHHGASVGVPTPARSPTALSRTISLLCELQKIPQERPALEAEVGPSIHPVAPRQDHRHRLERERFEHLQLPAVYKNSRATFRCICLQRASEIQTRPNHALARPAFVAPGTASGIIPIGSIRYSSLQELL